MSEYADHPIAAIFPLLPDEELKALSDNIRDNGLKNDIVIYEGKILDGRNRYRACKMAGVRCTITQYAGDDPVGHVLSLNLHRRHLSAGQKAAVAAEALPHFEEEAKKRRAHGSTAPGKSLSQKVDEASKDSNDNRAESHAAKLVGTNRQYVHDAAKIKEESPETFEKLKSGELSMRQAKEEIAPEKPEPTPEPINPKPDNEKGAMSWGITYAEIAITQLEKIRSDDTQRDAAYLKVAEWLNQARPGLIIIQEGPR